MNYRSRKLLDLAHDAPCMADFPHVCNGPSVPAHSNELMWGRGASHRAPDWATAALCPLAHDIIDGRQCGWTKEDKHAAWLRAYIKTQAWLWREGKVRVA